MGKAFEAIVGRHNVTVGVTRGCKTPWRIEGRDRLDVSFRINVDGTGIESVSAASVFFRHGEVGMEAVFSHRALSHRPRRVGIFDLLGLFFGEAICVDVLADGSSNSGRYSCLFSIVEVREDIVNNIGIDSMTLQTAIEEKGSQRPVHTQTKQARVTKEQHHLRSALFNRVPLKVA